ARPTKRYGCERERDQAKCDPETESLGNQANGRRAEQEAAIAGGRYRGNGEFGQSAGGLAGSAEQDRHGIGQSQPHRGEAEKGRDRTAEHEGCSQERGGYSGACGEHNGSTISRHHCIAAATTGGQAKRKSGEAEGRYCRLAA